MQTVSSAADLFLLLMAFLVIALVAAAIVQLARRRRSGSRLAAMAAGLVLTYAVLLVAAGVSAGSSQLAVGDTKCFDDWCVALLSARIDATSRAVVVSVRLENRGRRPMRSDLARGYLEVPHSQDVAPLEPGALQATVPPGQPLEVQLTFPAPPSLSGVRFVVTEDAGGVGPGTFEIGGEASPFHGKAGWPLPGFGPSGQRADYRTNVTEESARHERTAAGSANSIRSAVQ